MTKARVIGFGIFLLLLLPLVRLLPMSIALIEALGARRVAARAETDPGGGVSDRADDVCIWVGTNEHSNARVVATDKKASISVYDGSGRRLQQRTDGKLHNVDIRHRVRIGTGRADVVVATGSIPGGIRLYTIGGDDGRLEPIRLSDHDVDFHGEGLCLSYDRSAEKLEAFVSERSGSMLRLNLEFDDDGNVTPTVVGRLDFDTAVEGCVVDEDHKRLYVAAETQGILRLPLDKPDPATAIFADTTWFGHVAKDVEGLAIYDAGHGEGYLIASSQGSSSYAVYGRGGDNPYVTTFTIGAGEQVDAVWHGSGIGVSSQSLSAPYEGGMFVAQDRFTFDHAENFKMVPWRTIAESAEPHLIVANTRLANTVGDH